MSERTQAQSSAEIAAFRPYTDPETRAPEFTLRAVLAGVLFGIIFGAANAYLGLRLGLTISTSIPLSVMTVAAFAAFRRIAPTHVLEANMSQTIGSASSSLASGTLFTLPALFLWGLDPTLVRMTLLALIGGVIGTLFMVPLRRLLIVREHGKLPYPEGTACAEVIKASLGGGNRGGLVFAGLGVGALAKTLTAGLHTWPDTVHVNVPGLLKGRVGTEVSAALTGVGYILGFRVSAIMVSGGLLSSLVIIPAIALWGADRTTPLYPEAAALIRDMSPRDLWTRYVRYIGAGAVAMAGLLTLARTMPTMIASFRVGTREMRQRLAKQAGARHARTDVDLPSRFLFGGVALMTLMVVAIPNLLGSGGTLAVRAVAALLISILAFFFATVSSRIVGLVGVTSNPTSGMTIAALLITSSVFYACGWTDAVSKAAVLMVGTIICVSASIAGDTSQDLKTGYILGATPSKQQIGQLIGVITSALPVCATLVFLDRTYEFGSTELPAPQATLMKLVIEGVLDSELPWTLVLIGMGIAIVVDLLRLPTLAFAVGVYLPGATMVPIFFGGLLRRWLEKRAPSPAEAEARTDRGVLFASGLVGGEGLVGVGIAGVAWYLKRAPDGIGSEWAGPAAGWVAFAVAMLLVWLVGRAALRRDEAARR